MVPHVFLLRSQVGWDGVWSRGYGWAGGEETVNLEFHLWNLFSLVSIGKSFLRKLFSRDDIFQSIFD